jgi:hypothetical protein
MVAFALQAAIQAPTNIDVSHGLPHVELPIADHEEESAHLDVAVDTCAALNIGDYKYHAAVAHLNPHLVAEFVTLPTDRHINIGGISGGDKPQITVEAIIRYKTPFRVNGKQVLLSFGLAQGTATTTLVGIPFLTKAKAVFSFHDDAKLTLNAFVVDPLRIIIKPPTVRSPPTSRFVRGMPTSLLSPTVDYDYSICDWYPTADPDPDARDHATDHAAALDANNDE